MSITELRPDPGPWGARVDLAAAHRLAIIDGLNEGTWNHFSMRLPGDGDQFLISPPSVHWSLVRASSLVQRGPESEPALEQAGGLAWVGYGIHAPILAARPDVEAVLHVHSPAVVALSTLEDPRLEPAEQGALDLYARLAVTDRYDAEMPGGMAHGETLATQLGDKDVLIMRCHGALVVGPTLAEAYTDTYALERAAAAMLLALASGRPLHRFSDRRARELTAGGKPVKLKRDHFAAMKDVLVATQPDFAT
jgi:ribulose-5-phosphate 4-epimerase/fuculose-1-phosphate aldolase